MTHEDLIGNTHVTIFHTNEEGIKHGVTMSLFNFNSMVTRLIEEQIVSVMKKAMDPYDGIMASIPRIEAELIE